MILPQSHIRLETTWCYHHCRLEWHILQVGDIDTKSVEINGRILCFVGDLIHIIRNPMKYMDLSLVLELVDVRRCLGFPKFRDDLMNLITNLGERI